MKRVGIITLMILSLASVTRAQLVNGSLEVGVVGVYAGTDLPKSDTAITGWRIFDTTKSAVTFELINDAQEATDGNNYVKITSTTTSTGDAALDITMNGSGAVMVSTGVTYTVSFDAKRVDGTDNNLALTIRTFDGNTIVEKFVAASITLTSEWATYTYVITPTLLESGGAEPNFYIGFRPKAGHLLNEVICLDNVRVTPDPTSPNAPTPTTYDALDMGAPYTSALTVDGDASDWATLDSTSIYMDTSLDTRYVRDGDLGVDISYAWDTNYLYILVVENADTVVAGTVVEATSQSDFGTKLWSSDTVNFFVDLDNSCGVTTGTLEQDRDCQFYMGFSSTGLNTLWSGRPSLSSTVSPDWMSNCVFATSGSFSNHDRTIEGAIAWADIESGVAANRQPNGSIIASLQDGIKIGIEPIVVYNGYSVAQSFYNVAPKPCPTGSDTNSLDVAFMVPGYSTFATDYDLQQGADGDDDNDGLSNLYEYGLGGNPTNGFVDANLPTYSVMDVAGSNALVYVYARQKTYGYDMNYHLELTDDLVSPAWTNAGYTVLPLQGEINADFESVTNQIPIVDDQEYIRLVIEQN